MIDLKVKPNIDIVNALIRITLGLTILSWSTAKLIKRPWRESYLIMSLLGAMKVAEGIVRFCPITLLYEKYQKNMTDSNGTNGSLEGMEGLTNL